MAKLLSTNGTLGVFQREDLSTFVAPLDFDVPAAPQGKPRQPGGRVSPIVRNPEELLPFPFNRRDTEGNITFPPELIDRTREPFDPTSIEPVVRREGINQLTFPPDVVREAPATQQVAFSEGLGQEPIIAPADANAQAIQDQVLQNEARLDEIRSQERERLSIRADEQRKLERRREQVRVTDEALRGLTFGVGNGG